MPGAGWEHLYGYHDVMKIIYTSTMYLQLAFGVPHPTTVGMGSLNQLMFCAANCVPQVWPKTKGGSCSLSNQPPPNRASPRQ